MRLEASFCLEKDTCVEQCVQAGVFLGEGEASMMRTLIALAATVALTLPSVAEQNGNSQGSKQLHRTQDQDGSRNRDARAGGDRGDVSRRSMRDIDRERGGRGTMRGRTAYLRSGRGDVDVTRGRTAIYRDYDAGRGYGRGRPP